MNEFNKSEAHKIYMRWVILVSNLLTKTFLKVIRRCTSSYSAELVGINFKLKLLKIKQ
jgi:hypothetical protein